MKLYEPEAILEPMAERCKHSQLAVDYRQEQKENHHSNEESVQQNVSHQSITFSLTCISATVTRIYHKESPKGWYKCQC